jgi:hypothetical protein
MSFKCDYLTFEFRFENYNQGGEVCPEVGMKSLSIATLVLLAFGKIECLAGSQASAGFTAVPKPLLLLLRPSSSICRHPETTLVRVRSPEVKIGKPDETCIYVYGCLQGCVLVVCVLLSM